MLYCPVISLAASPARFVGPLTPLLPLLRSPAHHLAIFKRLNVALPFLSWKASIGKARVHIGGSVRSICPLFEYVRPRPASQLLCRVSLLENWQTTRTIDQEFRNGVSQMQKHGEPPHTPQRIREVVVIILSFSLSLRTVRCEVPQDRAART